MSAGVPHGEMFSSGSHRATCSSASVLLSQESDGWAVREGCLRSHPTAWLDTPQPEGHPLRCQTNALNLKKTGMFSLASAISLSGWRRGSRGRKGERAFQSTLFHTILAKELQLLCLFTNKDTKGLFLPWALYIDNVREKNKGKEKRLGFIIIVTILFFASQNVIKELWLVTQEGDGIADMAWGDFTLCK